MLQNVQDRFGDDPSPPEKIRKPNNEEGDYTTIVESFDPSINEEGFEESTSQFLQRTLENEAAIQWNFDESSEQRIQRILDIQPVIQPPIQEKGWVDSSRERINRALLQQSPLPLAPPSINYPTIRNVQPPPLRNYLGASQTKVPFNPVPVTQPPPTTPHINYPLRTLVGAADPLIPTKTRDNQPPKKKKTPPTDPLFDVQRIATPTEQTQIDAQINALPVVTLGKNFVLSQKYPIVWKV